jgi:flagellar biosynthesis anti-sigma factor FlgM
MDVRDRSSLTPPARTLTTEAAGEVRRGTLSSPNIAGVTPAADRSEVSAMARTLASAAQQPEVRQSRVSELQQRIASGTYTVAPQDVANAMLRNLGSPKLDR